MLLEVPIDVALAGCTTRAGGRSKGVYANNNLAFHVGDDSADVQANRDALQQHIGAQRIQWLDQIHSCDCIQSTFSTARSTPQADAMWTDSSGLALAILTADCLPILLWAPQQSVVAAVHAGWRGLRDGVIETLVGSLPVSAGSLHAWIGPCISQNCYEVGEEVWSQFVARDPGALRPVSGQVDKRLMNLSLIAAQRLTALGLTHIRQSGFCTHADPRFYSYRRDGVTGRIASVIMRRS
jgi:hypothetical protein